MFVTYIENVNFILVSRSLAKMLEKTFENKVSQINPSGFGSNYFKSLSFTMPGRLQYSRTAMRSSFFSRNAGCVRQRRVRSL